MRKTRVCTYLGSSPRGSHTQKISFRDPIHDRMTIPDVMPDAAHQNIGAALRNIM